jgi:hypothetical protein
MFRGCAKDEVVQSSGTVIKTFEGGDMNSTIMKVEHNHNSIVNKDETMLSHKNSHGEDYTQLVNRLVEEVDADDESLMRISNKHKEMMSYGTQESHGFKMDHWCVYVGYEENQNENQGADTKKNVYRL